MYKNQIRFNNMCHLTDGRCIEPSLHIPRVGEDRLLAGRRIRQPKPEDKRNPSSFLKFV